MISGWVSRTSLTRTAETLARGSMIKTKEIIRKAKIICMAYCMAAIISPTCMAPISTCWAPTQMISSIDTVHDQHHHGHQEDHHPVDEEADSGQFEYWPGRISFQPFSGY